VKEREIRRELDLPPDPLQHAEHVKSALKNGDEEKTFMLTQKASKKMPCTVSWNHLIDNQMSKGHVVPAMKTYHGVRPDMCPVCCQANEDRR